MKFKSFWKLFFIVVLLYFVLQIRLIGESSILSAHNFLYRRNPCDHTNHLDSYIFPDTKPRDVGELHNRKVPNLFHFVICNENTNHSFLFKHYLSVLNIWRNFEPDKIEIHHKGEVIQDKYNTWLNDLKSLIPCLVMKPIPGHWLNNDVCDISYGRAVLQDRGGVYVALDVILTKHALLNMDNAFSVLVDSVDNVKVIFSERKHSNLTNLRIRKRFNEHLIQKYDNGTNFEKKTNICVGENSFTFTSAKCVVLSKQYYPKDFFEPSSILDKYLSLLYHNIDSVNIVSNFMCHKRNPIPKIVHYIWFHPVTLTYMMYLSLISSLYILKPEAVYIHGDLHISGDYWDMLKFDPRIVLVYRENPNFIYGHWIKYTTHGSDIVRADILLKYGGIYQDWDVLWLNPVDRLLDSGNEVILNYDHMVASKSFPAQLNLGVTLAAPRSKFIRAWRDALINYRTDDFYYNALELPYKIFEKSPESVKIDKKLQVMCFRLKCHPIYHRFHRDWTKHQDFDWQDVYSVHFTYPDPPEYLSEQNLYNSTGLFAEIGRHIVEAREYSMWKLG